MRPSRAVLTATSRVGLTANVQVSTSGSASTRRADLREVLEIGLARLARPGVDHVRADVGRRGVRPRAVEDQVVPGLARREHHPASQGRQRPLDEVVRKTHDAPSPRRRGSRRPSAARATATVEAGSGLREHLERGLMQVLAVGLAQQRQRGRRHGILVLEDPRFAHWNTPDFLVGANDDGVDLLGDLVRQRLGLVLGEDAPAPLRGPSRRSPASPPPPMPRGPDGR